jgi:hypothetical protein
MLIPDRTFSHPGSELSPSQIRIKEFNCFNPKKWFLSSENMIRVVHPRSRIRMLTFCQSRIPYPGVEKAPDPDPQHWILTEFAYFFSLPVKNKLLCFFGYKKRWDIKFIFNPLFVHVVGPMIESRIDKNRDLGSVINVPDPQHCWQMWQICSFSHNYIVWDVLHLDSVGINNCYCQCCGSGSGIWDECLFWPLDPGSRIPDPKPVFLRVTNALRCCSRNFPLLWAMLCRWLQLAQLAKGKKSRP